MMIKYLVSGVADDATLSAVIKAFGGQITLSPVPEVQADAPFPVAQSQSVQQTEALKAPVKRRQMKRVARHNGGEWPAKGSIYDVVLQSIQTEPKTPTQLRAVLEAGGFRGGSVNSALGRLEKANRIRRGLEGGWIAA